VTSLTAYVLSLILSAFPPGKHPEVETREVGAARLEVVARAEADAARAFGAGWPEGAVDLARAGTSAFGWSMGFRRDVQTGAKRGPAGEACFTDLHPATLRRFANFETAGRTDAELAMLVVGLDYDSLRRCFDAGFSALVHVRAVSARRCKSNVLLGTFALYANGNYCHTPGRGWIERKRLDTLLRFRARGGTFFPDWYQAEEEPAS
jgi:hypothetical protein